MRSLITNSLALIIAALCLFTVSSAARADCTNPAGTAGTMPVYNTSTQQFQYCDGADWIAMHPPGTGGTPSDCSNVGDVCSDGTVYAGLSPDGNVPMYTTAADASSGIPWNNGNASDNTTTSQTSTTTGETNTANLITLDSDSGTAGNQPHQAAQLCADSTANGHGDWYLLAIDELDLLRNGGTPIAGVDTANWYWSSTEGNSIGAFREMFSNGNQWNLGKWDVALVRCVRKGYVAATGCANPDRPEGALIYNPSARVMQGCAGNVWRAMGPVEGSGSGGPPLLISGSAGGYDPEDSSDSRAVTVHASAQFFLVQGTMWPGPGDTITATLAGNAPDISAQGIDGDGGRSFFFGWLSPPTGSQTLALSGGDGGDVWAVIYSAWTSVDQATPFDGYANDDGVRNIVIATDTNSVAIGQYWPDANPSPVSPAVQIFEHDDGGDTYWFAAAYEAGTGGNVQIDWTGGSLGEAVTAGINLRGSDGGPCTDPERPEGTLLYNSSGKVMQYCDGVSWVQIGAPPPPPSDPCAGSPSPGDVCADGTVYAGLSPDGNVAMYTTAADEGGAYSWNNGNLSGTTTTSQTSNVTGATNTANLIGIDSNSGVGGTQPHQAAQACADLTANGQTDWYLPAWNELGVLYTNKAAIGGFNTSGSWPAGYYWSSTEKSNSDAKSKRFSDALVDDNDKMESVSIRCVRR